MVCSGVGVGVTARLVSTFVANYDKQTPVAQRDASLHQRPDTAVDFLPHACCCEAPTAVAPISTLISTSAMRVSSNVLPMGGY